MLGLTGPEFLALYWIAAVVLLGSSVATIMWVRRAPAGAPVPLDVYGVALLSGGPRRVAQTALAGLASRGAVHVSRSGKVTTVDGVAPADPYEETVLERMRTRRDFTRIEDSPVLRDLTRRMSAAGYLPAVERAARARKIGWLWLLLFAFGVYRITTGLINGFPVGFLILSTIGVAVLWLMVMGSLGNGTDHRPTPRGREAVAGAGMALGAAVLLPVALAGLTAYPDPAMGAALDSASAPTSSGSSSDSGSSGGDSGSSCGGGGGCGGCGGCG